MNVRWLPAVIMAACSTGQPAALDDAALTPEQKACRQDFPNGFQFTIEDRVGDGQRFTPIEGECINIRRIDADGNTVEFIEADAICFCDGTKRVVE